jgi:hypothetical protein
LRANKTESELAECLFNRADIMGLPRYSHMTDPQLIEDDIRTLERTEHHPDPDRQHLIIFLRVCYYCLDSCSSLANVIARIALADGGAPSGVNFDLQ